MAKSIMIQGTMSNVGKSILVGGLCRILKQDGVRVAPFKSQNMALNSFITGEGLEMGRAQVMQAEAAGISPSVDMNPILLKPTTDTGSQVIVRGEVTRTMSAAEYFRKKKEYVPMILEAYHRLEEQYDVIVIEGAGSPAEINLKQNDIVNMGLADMVNAPVILAGDIDRGGVFAQIVGTIALLEEHERMRVKGTIINKFRGDKEILKPGLTMLEERTGIPVCGVVPYLHLDIDEEDSLTERFDRKAGAGLADIVVIRLPRISNFTDFAPLEHRKELSVRYVSSTADFGNPDAVLIPGSKNTMEDLLWMRQNGLEGKILRHAAAGKLVFGICGGYQMLGEEIHDPDRVERGGHVQGMGLLPVSTVFQGEKTRTRIHGCFGDIKGILSGLSGVHLEGYEIHMGRTVLREGNPLLQIQDDAQKGTGKADGTWQQNVYGCYIHGIFDSAETSDGFVKAVLKAKGLDAGQVITMDYSRYKDRQYDLLADALRENLDMKYIYEVIEKGMNMPCSL
ncbi:MAG: cobyric acid synthase [Bariatricus sp.]